MEGDNDVFRRPGPPQPHSLSNEDVGDERTLGAGPSNLRSVGIPNKPGGTQYRGKVGRPRKTANQVKGIPSSVVTSKKKRREFQEFLAQVSLVTDIQELERTQVPTARGHFRRYPRSHPPRPGSTNAVRVPP